MIVGDTHGNYGWLRSYIFPVAWSIEADAIVVVGDFGAWEHTAPGITFMSDVDDLAAISGIPLYWLHGNHDKFTHTLAAYGRQRDKQGFVVCRENVFYIPQGHTWTWDKVKFRAFGGAYSIDKGWRIERERARYAKLQAEARRKVGLGSLFASEAVPSQDGTLWFPEEEMTDGEMGDLLTLDSGPKDIILSHDKPLSANPGWGRKNYPACVPNQIRLEAALRQHRPAWWIHGHLHYFYTDKIHGQGFATEVMGLDADVDAAESNAWKRETTWSLVDTKATPLVRSGLHVPVKRTDLDSYMKEFD